MVSDYSPDQRDLQFATRFLIHFMRSQPFLLAVEVNLVFFLNFWWMKFLISLQRISFVMLVLFFDLFLVLSAN